MKKKLLSILLALCMVLALLPGTAGAANNPISGPCGENATWSYDAATKTLTISGSGEIYGPAYGDAGYITFYNIKEEAEKVIFNGEFTAIGNYALRGFSSLKEISIPSSITTIGNRAFSECKSLTTITIPGSVNAISNSMFEDCSSLAEVTIANGVKYIGRSAFSGCSSLTHISFPASVIRIGGSVNEVYTTFSGCTSLTDITVDPRNTEYASQDGALFTKEMNTILFCPPGKTSFMISDHVNAIRASAFRGCTKLTTISIPDSIDAMGMWAFQDCTSLTTVNFPTKISTNHHDYASMSYTFLGCTSLTEITIPEGVARLNGTFSGCSSLETVHLPVSLKGIYDGTFYNCLKLKNIVYSGTETQWAAIDIYDTPELKDVNITFLNQTTPSTPDKPTTPDKPDTPDTPTTPGALTVSYPTSGGLGRQVTVQVPSGHWLTVQTRRAGSISVTSLQAPANTSGMASVTVSASAGSVLQIWETASEMQFSNGVPLTPILNTAVRQL